MEEPMDVEDVGAEGIVLPDEVMNRYLDGGQSATTDLDEEESEYDEASDQDEADDEVADDGDAGQDESDDQEDELFEDKITDADRKRIAADPSLRKVQKEMERAFYKKMEELASLRKQLEIREQRMSDFETTLTDPEKAGRYIGNLLSLNPMAAFSALEAVATGDNAMDFLVEIGLNDPELFDKAYERYREITEDETEMKRYERERQQRIKELELRRREDQIRKDNFARDLASVDGWAVKEARRRGLDDEELGQVRERLKSKIRERIKEDGSIDISSAEVKAIVSDVERELSKLYERVMKKAGVSDADRVKKLAAKGSGSSKAPLKGSRSGAAKASGKFKPPENEDPLMAFINFRLEQL